MKGRNFRSQSILLVTVLALSLSIWLINWARTPELNPESFPGDGQAVERENWQMYGYEEKGKFLKAGSEGSYILLRGFRGKIQSVSVRVNSQLPSGTILTLHYPDASGGLSPDRMEEAEASEGMTEYLFTMPPKEYSFLRLGIPADFVPGEILVSPSPLNAATHVIPPFRIRDFAIPFFILLALGELILHIWPRLSEKLRALIKARKSLGIGFLKLLGAGVILALAAWPLCSFRGIPYTWQHAAFFLLLGAMIYGLWLFRNHAAEHPQRVFALVCLGIGLMFIAASPLTSYIPGDGGIHYRHALSLSYGGQAYITKAERSLMGLIEFPVYSSNSYNGIYFDHMRAHVSKGALYIMEESPLSYPSPLYLPGAFGLWLGRFFGMHFVVGYALGRAVNLLAYALIVCLAIKLARRGRVLLCVVSLLPSALFQASTYSPGGIAMALAMLCTVLLFRRPEGERDTRSILIKSGLIAAIVLAAFMTPAAALGGKLPVTAGDQVSNILSNPLGAVKMFARFILKDLLGSGFMTELGNLSTLTARVPGAMLFLAALGITALTEPEEEPLKVSVPLRAGLFAGLCFCVGVIILCTYLICTPAGQTWITGFQGRWLLPVLFPLLYLLRLPQIKSTFHRGRYLYVMISPALLLTVMQLWRILRCFR